VRAAAARLGYIYDTTAQAFRAQRSGCIAITLPSINNANFATTHRALTTTLDSTPLQLLLGITGYSLREEERLIRQLLARRPEAVVLTGGTHSEQTRDLLQSSDIPVIEIWDQPRTPLAHSAGFSNAQAMRPVVEHLAQTGRRQLAFLGASGDSAPRGAARRQGVIMAAAELGLPKVVTIEAGEAPISMTEGAEAIRTSLPALRDCEALVCVSDPVAFGALSACRKMGIEVPRDIAITGFGAFEIAAVSVPSITTVDVSAARIGELTAQIIIDLLANGGRAQTPIRIDTGAKLRLGETS